MADIKTLLVDLARVKALEDELAKEKASIQDDLIDALKDAGQKTASTTLGDGIVVKGTLVEGERVVYDEERLKKSLGAKTWPKVTKQVLDKEKLEAAITMGDVDANAVAACAEIKANRPFVKVSGTFNPQDLARVTSAPVRKVRKPRATPKG